LYVKTENNRQREAQLLTGAGDGAATSIPAGGMELAMRESAVSIGLAPVAITEWVIVLAIYGLKHARRKQ